MKIKHTAHSTQHNNFLAAKVTALVSFAYIFLFQYLVYAQLAALSLKKRIAFLPLAIAQLIWAVLFIYKSVLFFYQLSFFIKKG